MTRTVLIAASLAVLAGCTFLPRRVAAPQTEHALPARNPSSRATVQEPLEQNQIDYVSMKAAVFDERPGSFWTGLEWRDILRPALGPAQALEVRHAFEACVWKPAVGPNGEPAQAAVTLAIQRRELPAPPPSK